MSAATTIRIVDDDAANRTGIGVLNASILIVDDQALNVKLLALLLREAGYTRIASTMEPLEVCALHRKNRYDLILLDLRMPGMDGFQVMDGLKEIEADGYLPVLVLTAQPDEKLRALRAGAKDFLSKPFELAELMARVRNILEVRQLHVETKRLYDELLAEHKLLIELSAQPGAMVGVKKDERLATPWYRSLGLRLPWLQLNLVAAFVAAAVVGLFQETIDRLLILTMFLPVLAGQSGNTGSQALAVTLRGVFLGELDLVKERSLVMKEALLGLLNGALVGLVAAFCMYAVAAVKHMPNALMLSVVVFLSMIGSCVISGALGAVTPLVLRKLGADPVIASSIFLTTATNVASMGMLLGLATLLVK